MADTNFLAAASTYYDTGNGWTVGGSSIAFSGTQLSWDSDGYLIELASNSGGYDYTGIVDYRYLMTVTVTSGTVYLRPQYYESGYSGPYGFGTPVLCVSGVPTVLTCPYTTFIDIHEGISLVPWDNAGNQPLVSLLGTDYAFALSFSVLLFGPNTPPISSAFWTDFIGSSEILS